MTKTRLIMVISLVMFMISLPLLGACTKEVVKEVPVEKVVEKEVVKEVPVEKVVKEEVVKEVEVEKVVEKEVVKGPIKIGMAMDMSGPYSMEESPNA